MHRSPKPSRAQRAFTLIELLIVIAITSILIAISVTVGLGLQSAARARSTKATIQIADTTVQDYYTETGSGLPSLVVAPNAIPNAPIEERNRVYPMLDGVDLEDGNDERRRINTMGLFINQLAELGLNETFTAPDTEIYREIDGDIAVEPDAPEPDLAMGEYGRQPSLPTLFDAWGNPLRFVHHALDGIITDETLMNNPTEADYLANAPVGGTAFPIVETVSPPTFFGTDRLPAGFQLADMDIIQVRRNAGVRDANAELDPTIIGDSDGGSAPSDRPYIYSAGPDGNPATTEDNVYTVLPRFRFERE